MHADGATEAIVDAALLYCEPFVVMPCCVFPDLFCERYITAPINDASEDSGSSKKENERNNSKCEPTVEKRIPHDQFCEYLLSKDPRFVRELPFEGRSVAIWWDGLK